MKKIIFGLILLTGSLFAEPEITVLSFNGHSYLCFNGTQYIHDPDCKCRKWMYRGRTYDQQNHFISHIEIYRAQPSAHD